MAYEPGVGAELPTIGIMESFEDYFFEQTTTDLNFTVNW